METCIIYGVDRCVAKMVSHVDTFLVVLCLKFQPAGYGRIYGE